MKNKIFTYALCLLLFAGCTYFSATSFEEVTVTSSFIFGDISGGY